MSTDKLAEALTEIRCPMDPDPLGKVYADHVAAWLRSPAGIDALTGDETIREGIKRAERHAEIWPEGENG